MNIKIRKVKFEGKNRDHIPSIVCKKNYAIINHSNFIIRTGENEICSKPGKFTILSATEIICKHCYKIEK